MWIFYTAAAMVFYAMGDYLSVLYANPEGRPWHMWAGVAAYTCTVVLWFPALSDKNNICVLGMLWTAFYTIIGLVIGLWCFKQPLTGLQMAGVAVTAVGVFMLLK